MGGTTSAATDMAASAADTAAGAAETKAPPAPVDPIKWYHDTRREATAMLKGQYVGPGNPVLRAHGTFITADNNVRLCAACNPTQVAAAIGRLTSQRGKYHAGPATGAGQHVPVYPSALRHTVQSSIVFTDSLGKYAEFYASARVMQRILDTIANGGAEPGADADAAPADDAASDAKGDAKGDADRLTVTLAAGAKASASASAPGGPAPVAPA